MAKELRRVKLDPNTDLLHILEDVHLDKAPRLIEREGEPLAVVVDPGEYVGYPPTPKSKRFKKELLSSAGVWTDLDADEMIKELYKARHEAPPSSPIDLWAFFWMLTGPSVFSTAGPMPFGSSRNWPMKVWR